MGVQEPCLLSFFGRERSAKEREERIPPTTKSEREAMAVLKGEIPREEEASTLDNFYYYTDKTYGWSPFHFHLTPSLVKKRATPIEDGSRRDHSPASCNSEREDAPFPKRAFEGEDRRLNFVTESFFLLLPLDEIDLRKWTLQHQLY